jgi:hypothetical protein
MHCLAVVKESLASLECGWSMKFILFFA